MISIQKEIEQHLSSHHCRESKLHAEHLLARVIGCGRLEIYSHRKEEIDEDKLEKLWLMVDRLVAGEPLQYVLGDVEFMGLTLKVDHRALIPRPETEELVEHILTQKSLWQIQKPRIADVGTGSGCIVISLAHFCPNGCYFGIDKDGEALSLAKENAEGYNLHNIQWLQSDLLNQVPEDIEFNAVVANLPYIPTDTIQTLDKNVKDFEPRQALDGGSDGLLYIFNLVKQAYSKLVKGGMIFLEIGDNQGKSVEELLQQSGFCNIQIHKDLAGNERIAHAEK